MKLEKLGYSYYTHLSTWKIIQTAACCALLPQAGHTLSSFALLLFFAFETNIIQSCGRYFILDVRSFRVDCSCHNDRRDLRAQDVPFHTPTILNLTNHLPLHPILLLFTLQIFHCSTLPLIMSALHYEEEVVHLRVKDP